jgi:hypothetical protein
VSSAASSLPSNNTVIFGYGATATGQHNLKGFSRQSGNWRLFTAADTDSGSAAGWNGDPGAAYMDGAATRVMTCMHAAFGPGYMYCSRGVVDETTQLGYYGEIPRQVGTKTFPAGSSPALVDIMGQSGSRITYLFARGADKQIYFAYYHYLSDTWNGWFQVPPPRTANTVTFGTDPAVTTYDAGNQLLVVCARADTDPVNGWNQKYICNKQQFVNGGGIAWQTTWSGPLDMPPMMYRPTLARTSTRVYLFGVSNNSTHNQYVNSFPVNGGGWLPSVQVSFGSGFLAGPSATGTTAAGSDSAFTVGLAGGSMFWYATGSASSGWSGWTPIN